MTITNPFVADNDGVGAVNLSMAVDTTSTKDFTQTDMDNNLGACVVSGNNEAGMGSAGDKLLGKVVSVSAELDGDDIPVSCTVQVGGVARFVYAATTPVVGQMVEVDGAGKVRQAAADTDIAAGGHLARGQVIAVNTTDTTCDVWLG